MPRHFDPEAFASLTLRARSQPSSVKWEFPKIRGPYLGVSLMRIVIYSDLVWDPRSLGAPKWYSWKGRRLKRREASPEAKYQNILA